LIQLCLFFVLYDFDSAMFSYEKFILRYFFQVLVHSVSAYKTYTRH